MSISIIDYGLGNLNSIVNMISRVGGDAKICDNPDDIIDATKVILPGVGAFDHGVEGLRKGGWIEPLNDLVLNKKVPTLGICLGMQLMCKSSEEGQLPGLGWIDATVKRFEILQGSTLKVPHMGWNTITVNRENELINEAEGEQRFYFVHSYYVVCNNANDIHTTSYHGCNFTAAFSHENIYGVQFHPEKSHRFGMKLFNKFMAI